MKLQAVMIDQIDNQMDHATMHLNKVERSRGWLRREGGVRRVAETKAAFR